MKHRFLHRYSQALLLASLLFGLASQYAFAESDPLPSWNEGTVKKSITDFIAALPQAMMRWEGAMTAGARFAKWGLGLFIFGVFLTFGIIAHYCVGARWPTGELFKQNIVGLLGVFAVGYPGYFVFDAIWPSYHYSPVAAGKNAWLLGQALFIALYFVGLLIAFNDVRHALALAARQAPGALK